MGSTFPMHLQNSIQRLFWPIFSMIKHNTENYITFRGENRFLFAIYAITEGNGFQVF
jgi:hypothetical protein